MSKKNIFILISATILGAVLFYFLLFLFSYQIAEYLTSDSYFVKDVNKTLNINIPAEDIQYYIDDRGGFHGDGDTIAIIKLNSEDNESFKRTIDSKWLCLDQKSEIYDLLWDYETSFDHKPVGGKLNKRIIPHSDLQFILFDDETFKINENIEFNRMLDFYFVGYSYKNSLIYIQRTYF